MVALLRISMSGIAWLLISIAVAAFIILTMSRK